MDSADAAVAPCVAKPLRISAFRGVMLAPARVGDPASMRAFARPYRDVAQRLAAWIDRGHAFQDESPAVYLHEYTASGMTVRGVVGALSVTDRTDDLSQRAVWPHEAVHTDQAAELASRMEEMRLNPAPILLATAGSAGLRAWMREATDRSPDWSFTDRAQQQHRIWAVRSEDAIEALGSHLGQSQCLLADGHHRYAAYLALQHKWPGTAWDHGLAMIVDQGDTPFFVGAIHRVLGGVPMASLQEQARLLGSGVEETDRAGALDRMGQDTLLMTDGQSWAVLTPRLDMEGGAVTWLHETLLPAVGHPAVRSQHHDLEGAVANASATNPAVILPTPDFATVMSVVRQGRLLPEKATSFQPKPSVGVLMRPVTEPPDVPR